MQLAYLFAIAVDNIQVTQTRNQLNAHSGDMLSDFHPSADVLELVSKNVLNICTDGPTLMLSISDTQRSEMCNESTTSVRLDALVELCLHVIFAVPDIYATALWKVEYLALKPVMENVVIPFLSVVEQYEVVERL
jgi:hypothetical protein